MNEIAIHVEDLSKSYRIGRKQARYNTLRESIEEKVTSPFRRLKSYLGGHSAVELGETIWALKDVSFDIKKGEVIGIIGRNGAGKSTLLKILTSITEPTSGSAKILGRVGSLLEVGAGFHPELTGRENIFLNGVILGMKRTEINSKFDEIVSFSEIEKFIDTPVKHYSSGMYMRLAFAVAAQLETEILLIDEVLAVGDIGFQKKCIKKISEASSHGRTVLVVSHNLRVVETLASRCIYLKDGIISSIGETTQVIKQFQKDALSTMSASEVSPEFDVNIKDPIITISEFKFTNENNEEVEYFEPNIGVNLTCSINSSQKLDNIIVCLQFHKEKMVISGNNSENMIDKISINANEKYQLSIYINGLWLVPGNYSVVLFVLPNNFSSIAASISNFSIKNFIIQGSKKFGGGYYSMQQKWKLNNSSKTHD